MPKGTYRTKPGEPFEAIQFTGGAKSAREVFEFANANGGAAWRRPAQAPVYSPNIRRADVGFTEAMGFQLENQHGQSRRTEIEWIEVGQWLVTMNDTLRIIDADYFDKEFEVV